MISGRMMNLIFSRKLKLKSGCRLAGYQIEYTGPAELNTGPAELDICSDTQFDIR